MKQKTLLFLLLFGTMTTSAETSLIIQPLTGEAQVKALAQIGYIKQTPESLFIYSHADFLLGKAAIKDIRYIRYGERSAITTGGDENNASATPICRIYPNPTQDMLIIEHAEAGSAHIFDLSGRLLQTANLQDGTTTIHVNDLPEGEYLLLINTQTYKFLKQ